MTDPRWTGSAVAGVLYAAGPPSRVQLDRANAALAELGLPPLAGAASATESPESLAPRIPEAHRASLVRLLRELAGDEPIRARLADSYAALWFGTTPEAPVAREPRSTTPHRHSAVLTAGDRPRPSRVMRWLVGALPRHQLGDSPEDDTMTTPEMPYRSDAASVAAPLVRSSLRARVERIRDEYVRVVDAVEQVIVGKRHVIERVITAMAARGHVLLVDVPGVGKTQLCKAVAAAIATRFGRVQFTPDLLPMDVTGCNVFDVKDREFRFRAGPIFTHLLLADEINRATPKTQSALLEVMEERSVTVDGVTYQLEEPFNVLATMNPLDHQGTYALPAAQIDRFMMMLEIGMPSAEDEVRVLDFHLGAASPLDAVRPVISREAFIEWRDTVPAIHVTPELKRTVVDYINQLRRGSPAGQSLSPRATLSWVRAAQARAMLAGREFVTIEDILDIAPDILRHRLWTDAATVREKLRAVAIAGVR